MEKVKYYGTARLGYLGDFTAEWWTDKDWEEHRLRVEELKRTGDYGKEVNYCVELVHNALLDEGIDFSKKSKETISFMILDVSN